MSASKPKNSGFALFYAVLLSSVVLTVSLSLFNITYRQLVISSTVNDSQTALYIADSVRSCVLHARKENTQPFLQAGSNIEVNCLGVIVNVDSTENLGVVTTDGDFVRAEFDDGQAVRCFEFKTTYHCGPLDNSFCSGVSSDTSRQGKLEITASGYSRACSELDHPRNVQRTIFTR